MTPRMQLRTALFTLLVTPLLAAQDRPGVAPAPAASQLDRVLVDLGRDAPAACADAWKASFEPGGPRFVPFFGSRARTDHPLDLHLRRITVADAPLPLAAAAPRLHGMRVTYARGSVDERYDLEPQGIEQSFVFATLPKRGELTIEMEWSGDYVARANDGGIEFECDEGAVRYGRAFAIDADGQRRTLASRIDGETLRLVVPAEFVAAAALPLTIDPMIGTAVGAGGYTLELRSLDIAYSGPLSRYVTCYERVWSQTDSDVFATVLDGFMAEITTPLVIDISTTSWRSCAIACLRYASRFLIVAEVSTANASPFSIRGRLVDFTGGPVALPAFDIASATIPGMGSGDRIHPDVGGDPYPGQVWFTVVWERVYGSTDHDIQVIQVAPDGTLQSGTYRSFDTSLDLDHTPHISKSNGVGDRASQGWAVAWRRENGAGGGHYRAGVVHHDGTLRTFGAMQARHVAVTQTAPSSGALFDISSPDSAELGRRYVLLERRAGPGATPDQVHGTVFDRDLHNVVPSTLLFSGSPNPGAGAIRSLSIDCEGCRFSAVSTHSVSASDDDVQVRTFAIAGSTLAQHDLDTVAASPDTEGPACIVALWSGFGAGLRYGIAWAQRTGSTAVGLGYGRYQGTAGGAPWVVRQTGCGTLFLGVSGSPSLGSNFVVSLSGSASYTTKGILVGRPIQVAVPGCGSCVVGVDGFVETSTSLPLTVPCDAALFGVVIAFQGFGLGGGTCLGTLGLSNTYDVSLR